MTFLARAAKNGIAVTINFKIHPPDLFKCACSTIVEFNKFFELFELFELFRFNLIFWKLAIVSLALWGVGLKATRISTQN